jgi:N-methylhydantoinase A
LGDGCDAIAIGLLHSYANPTNELRARELVQEVAPDVHVVASHQILPVWREFERFASTVVSAYIGPALVDYLTRLEGALRDARFGGALLMMLTNGLVQVVSECYDRAVYLLGSGPAAAPSGSLHVARQHSPSDLLSVDMGGTSFDVCLVRDDEVPTTTEAWVGEERVAIRMVDVSSIGAGGGSIAWIDALGLLRVGPMSAGADPGPAAYGRGEAPTVTDADLVLGYIPADYFLAGEIQLDVGRAAEALGRVGSEIGLNAEETARAVYATVTAEMAGQITEVCTKRGYDVRDFVMVAGGGAGGVHAAAIARILSIPTVIVPRVAALLSAFGMFTMDVGQQYARSRFHDLARADAHHVEAIYAEMRREAEESFSRIGVATSDLRYASTVDMRYAGQFHEVEIELPDGPVDDAGLEELVRRFHDRYEVLYGYQLPQQPVEFLTFYLKVTAPRRPLEVATEAMSPSDVHGALRGTRSCLFDDGWKDTPAYDADLLRPGAVLEGPALVDDPTTTVVVPDGFTCGVDRHRNLILRARELTSTAPVRAVAATGRGDAT